VPNREMESDHSGCAEHGRPDCDDCFMSVCGGSEFARPDDPIVFGPTWRKALLEIISADPVDLALDPTWSQRVAREALNGGEDENA
jgi:hypothetical protein